MPAQRVRPALHAFEVVLHLPDCLHMNCSKVALRLTAMLHVWEQPELDMHCKLPFPRCVGPVCA